MFKQLGTYLKHGNQFYGIELTTINNSPCVKGVTLKKQKNTLDIKDTIEVTSLEALFNKLKTPQSFSLVINDSNVITKKVESSHNEPKKILFSAFPNIQMNDFWYEIISEKNIHFVSICRQDYVLSIQNQFKQEKHNIQSISLGSSLVKTLKSWISNNIIETTNACIELEENKIENINIKSSESTKQYNINGIKLSNNHVLSAASALQLVVNNNYSVSNLEELNTELKSSFYSKRFQKLFLIGGLATIFTLLLINTIFFNHYLKEVNLLRETSTLNLASKQKMIAVSKGVEEKKKIVEDIQKNGSSRASYYLNNIVNSLPNSILLSETNYQPLTKRLSEGKTIEQNLNTITVTGTTNDSSQFSTWLNELETSNWVNSIAIIEYTDLSKHKSSFNIKIELKNV